MAIMRDGHVAKLFIKMLLPLILAISVALPTSVYGISSDDLAMLRVGSSSGDNGFTDSKQLFGSSSGIPSPIYGTIRVLMVPTRFINYGNLTSIDSILNKVVDVKDYLIEVSYGYVDLGIWYITDWITLPRTREYYGADSNSTVDVNLMDYIRDTLNIIDPIVDLRNYDFIIMVHAGYDQAMSGDPYDIWSSASMGKWYFPEYDGGVYLGITIVAETDPYGVFAHEMGHNMGLPDLYDYYGDQEYVGPWSLMDRGSWLRPPAGLLAVERKWLGWVLYDNIVRVPRYEFRVVSLNHLSSSVGTLMVEIPVGSVYYTVEYRRKVGTDSGLPDEGVIISRVDESRGSGKGPVVVVDANPATKSKSDAAFKAGMMYINMAADFYVKVLEVTPTHAKVFVQNGIPNLYIADVDYVANGNEYTFYVDVANSGGATENITVTLFIDGVRKLMWRGPIYLAKDEVYTVTLPPVTLPVGDHSLLFVVDEYNEVIERDETDNTFRMNIRVTPLYVMDDYAVTDPRADVGTTQTVYIHFSDYITRRDYANKVVYVNNTAYVTNGTGWIEIDVYSSTVKRLIFVLTDPNGIQQVTPQIIFDKVVITLSLNDPDGRVDVGSSAPIEITARYAYDGRSFDGVITLNDDPYKNEVGRYTYTVVSIRDDLYGLTVFESNSVSVIFDRVIINIVYDHRVGVGTNPIIDIISYYEFDGEPFEGGIFFNDTVIKNVVGKFGFRVVSIDDSKYGLTVFTANQFSVIFDKVKVILAVERERVDVGSEAPILITAFYLYDGSEYDGDILLNDTLVKEEVGIYGYTVIKVGNDTYGIEAFESNAVSIIFDRVSITLYAEDDRINVGENATIYWEGFYEYDGEPFRGSVSLNGSLIQEEVGRYSYVVISIEDPLYGLTKFRSNVVSIIFDRVVVELDVVDDRVDVGSIAEIVVNAWYEYDGTPYDGIVVLNDSLRKEDVGIYAYTVARIGNDTYGITVFTSNVVEVVFDKVLIVLEALDNRVDVGSKAEIVWTGYYAYDGKPFKGNVSLSNPLVVKDVGLVRYEVVAIEDELYGLTVFESNFVEVVFDFVVVELSAERNYYLVGEDIKIVITAYYAYDGEPLEGEVYLNHPLRINEVGEYVFRATRVVDEKYGLTVFISDELRIVVDRLIVDYSVDNSIPFLTRLTIKVYSEYLGENVDADVYVNGERVEPQMDGYVYIKEFIGASPVTTYSIEVSFEGAELDVINVESTSYSTIASYLLIVLAIVFILYRLGLIKGLIRK